MPGKVKKAAPGSFQNQFLIEACRFSWQHPSFMAFLLPEAGVCLREH